MDIRTRTGGEIATAAEAVADGAAGEAAEADVGEAAGEVAAGEVAAGEVAAGEAEEAAAEEAAATAIVIEVPMRLREIITNIDKTQLPILIMLCRVSG